MDENTILVTAKFHPIDRIINLHQSVSLSAIRKQNHLMLKAQYAQCQQMQQLQREMQVNNSMTRQILENQLKEIQHKENLKYYKAVAYNIGEAVKVVSNTEDKVFKAFLNHLFHDVFKLYLQEAKENLEEISDKVFCSEIENALEANIEETLAVEDKYSASTFCTLLESEPDYKDRQIQLAEEKKKLIPLEKKYLDEKKKLTTPEPYKDPALVAGIAILGVLSLVFALTNHFILFAILFFLFVISIAGEKMRRKDYPHYLEEFKQKQEALEVNAPFLTAKKEYDDFENYVNTHPYIKAKNDLSSEYPTWEKVLEKIASYLPESKENEKKNIKIDPSLYEVAKWAILTTKQLSSSAIQRRFSIGYNRSCRIMNQLEELEIVKNGVVQFACVELLDEYWKRMNL